MAAPAVDTLVAFGSIAGLIYEFAVLSQDADHPLRTPAKVGIGINIGFTIAYTWSAAWGYSKVKECLELNQSVRMRMTPPQPPTPAPPRPEAAPDELPKRPPPPESPPPP